METLAVAALVVLAAQYGLAFGAVRRLRRSWSHASALRLDATPDLLQIARYMLGRDREDAVVVSEVWPGGYRARDRVLLLAPELLGTPSLAALAVVVHEAGHADQHQDAPMLLWINQALRRLAPLAFLLALGLGTFGIAVGSALGLLAAELAAEVVLVLGILVGVLERDASTRGLRLLAELLPATQSEAAIVRRLLDAAAWSYLALPIELCATLIAASMDLGSRSEPRSIDAAISVAE